MAKRWFAALNEWTTKERPETGRQRQRLKQLGMVQEDAHDVLALAVARAVQRRGAVLAAVV